MHILIVSYKSGRRENFGPFPTFFRANEYGKLLLALRAKLEDPSSLDPIIAATPVPLILTHTMRVAFK